MIKICNVSKYFGKQTVFKDISFNLAGSEIIVLTGPSGCGKTTLLRTIAGFENIDSGKIVIDEMEASTPDLIVEPYKRNLSMIFQDLALWPHMNVEKHITFSLKNKTMSKKTIQLKTQEILCDFKLEGYNKKYPTQLSGGEKQRLAIARALASKAKYLLMDEPFNNLDIILKDDLNEFLNKIKDNYKMGILYVTHHFEEILEIADKIAIMQDSKIVHFGSIQKLPINSNNEFVKRLLKNKAVK